MNRYYLKNDDGTYSMGDDGDYQIKMTDMGYAYSDYIGVSGLEYTMEAYLTGATNEHQGKREVEINKNLSITRELSYAEATNGNDVMSAIDIELQPVCENALGSLITKMREQEQQMIEEGRGKARTGPEISGQGHNACLHGRNSSNGSAKRRGACKRKLSFI